MILRDRALVANQVLQLVDFLLVFSLEALNILLRDLDVRLELEEVDEELSFISQFLLVVLNYVICARV